MALKGEIAKTFLMRFPSTPTLTLAKIMYKENPLLFSTVDSARSVLRYYRGASGEKKKEALLTDEYVKKGEYNPFGDLPEGLRHFSEWEPYNILGTKTLILADAHIPYHDKMALDVALNTGLQKNADTILLLGDWSDFFSVSFWEKDPAKRDMQKELSLSYDILKMVRAAYPDAEMVYKIGNHEERWERYLRVKAPELLNMEILQFEQVIKADSLNIKVIGDKRIVKIGNLNCVHAHEFGRSISSPVNPARGLYLRGKETAIGAHFHQTSEHAEKSMTGEVISCWSVGCLCDMRPDYLPINKWCHGFALVERDGQEFHVKNKKIINGKAY